ncbi:hypothetical protein HMPREF0322_02806 [Desulfitobacterium hafniense DP7]|uniref:Uncharacterized protein n=1 Tax=Desulfitobacterium hafniense DP7 TaxID=537010 RepID=G9XPA8_DESHA|nr:hypothetical protein HMPREF0322_02806 [Desulfitobacterium hafniense DP7]
MGQSSQGGGKHPPCHGGIRSEFGCRDAAEQSAVYRKLNIFLCPMAGNVPKGGVGLLIADAVDGKMT